MNVSSHGQIKSSKWVELSIRVREKLAPEVCYGSADNPTPRKHRVMYIHHCLQKEKDKEKKACLVSSPNDEEYIMLN